MKTMDTTLHMAFAIIDDAERERKNKNKKAAMLVLASLEISEKPVFAQRIRKSSIKL